MASIAIVQPGVSYGKDNFSAKLGLSLQKFFLKGAIVNSNEFGAFGSGKWFVAGRQPYDYLLVNPSLEANMKEVVGKYGVTANIDFTANVDETVKNIDAKYKNGYLVSLGIGDDKIGKLGTWQLKAGYHRLEAYAIPTGFGNVDAYGGKPGKGFEYSLTLGLATNLSFAFNVYDMTNLSGKASAQTGQFDFVYKF